MAAFSEVVSALSQYHVVLEPERNEPEWWAGAPTVARGDDGTFYLAARMREATAPKGKRGYETRLLKSADGAHFSVVGRISRADAGVAGFERPALVRDPKSGRFKLYSCAGFERGWKILKFDDVSDPARFDAGSVRPVLASDYPDDGFAHVYGYKDPVVAWEGGQWHLFVIGTDYIERIHHFVSDDGESWRGAGRDTVLENTGWHNFFTRPASVLRLAVGYLFVYEGSSIAWRDPVYNIATGLAYSPDLETFVDLTPDEPLLKSTTPGPYHTWRYSHWMKVEDAVYVYFEAARPNATNEIRLGIIKSGVIGLE